MKRFPLALIGMSLMAMSMSVHTAPALAGTPGTPSQLKLYPPGANPATNTAFYAAGDPVTHGLYVQSAAGPYGGISATLISNANAAVTGTALTGVFKDSYFFSCVAATWNSATAQLQALGPNATTYLPLSTALLSANGTVGIGLGANSTIRVVVTGTPTGLYCNIS